MDKLSEKLQQASDCGDFGRALEEYPEMARELERERDELRAHCAVFRSLYDNFGNNGFEDAQLIEAFGNQALMLPSQSLAEIKAQAVEMYADFDDEYANAGHRCCPRKFANQLRKEAE